MNVPPAIIPVYRKDDKKALRMISAARRVGVSAGVLSIVVSFIF
jgi:hypothetical protein